jgi:methyl-accepting chemotaxis protein
MFLSKSLKQENQRLQEELHTLRQARDSLDSDMIRMTLDAQAKVSSVNLIFEQELGLSLTDVQAKHITQLVPEKARNTNHFLRMKDTIAHAKHWNGAFELVKGDGSVAWLRAIIQPIFDINSQLLHYTVFASELTRTIQSSREHEDMMKALVRSTATIEFTLEGIILKANDNFLRVMGYKLDEIVGQHHRIFCEEAESSSPEYQQFWQQLARGQYVSDRFKRIDKHGHTIWLEASYNPVHNDRGELYKVVKFATNITDKVDQEQAVSSAADVAYGVSNQTREQTNQGGQIIDNTIETMQTLAEQMQEATNAIASLDENSQKISALLNSISGIAEQTNLLALNAAIEAARAGEQGRGFAVVADEVRELSARTNRTTDEVSRVVADNAGGTNVAVNLIAKCQAQASKALELSTEAGQLMQTIEQGAAQVAETIDELNKLHEHNSRFG